MNDFIEVTNRVMTEILKDKIKISSVDYYTVEDSFVICVKYYNDEFNSKGFRFSHYSVRLDKFILEQEFKCFIDNEVLGKK